MDWRTAGLVALGGALGALARFAVSNAAPRWLFPWHTLGINLAGSLMLGAFFLESAASDSTRGLVAIGFLGAFTTLSTFSVETVELWRGGRAGWAFANVVANGLGGPLMALLGWRASALWSG